MNFIPLTTMKNNEYTTVSQSGLKWSNPQVYNQTNQIIIKNNMTDIYF